MGAPCFSPALLQQRIQNRLRPAEDGCRGGAAFTGAKSLHLATGKVPAVALAHWDFIFCMCTFISHTKEKWVNLHLEAIRLTGNISLREGTHVAGTARLQCQA